MAPALATANKKAPKPVSRLEVSDNVRRHKLAEAIRRIEGTALPNTITMEEIVEETRIVRQELYDQGRL
jgi:hypothetical protein